MPSSIPIEIAQKLAIAVADQQELIRKAQNILASHLPPDGISQAEAISQLLFLLDHPSEAKIRKEAEEAIQLYRQL